MTETTLPRGNIAWMDPIREDLRELKRELRDDLKGIRESVESLSGKLSEHALEDADRQAIVATELGTMRTQLDTLDTQTGDRHRFVRGWVAGLLAVAIAATIGFLLRSAIDVQVARPNTPTVAAPQAAPSR